MKRWNLAFNAQGSRLIIVFAQVEAVKIYVAAVKALREKERGDETPKLVEKLVWLPVISFSKIFIPSYAFDALLCRNWPFSPPNRLTLTDNFIVFRTFKFFNYLVPCCPIYWQEEKTFFWGVLFSHNPQFRPELGVALTNLQYFCKVSFFLEKHIFGPKFLNEYLIWSL
jgi:hypothetical protein